MPILESFWGIALGSEVIDSKPVVEQSRKIVEEHKLGDRVSSRAGDLRTIDWEDIYDLILLFNILHNREEVVCNP